MRLFTKSPYPEFEYIVTPTPHMYCANSSLFAAARGTSFGFKWVDVSPDIVLDYVWEQTAILKYNNHECKDVSEYREALHRIFRWGTEDPYDKIAYDTIEEIINSVIWTEDVLDMIPSLRPKTLWYADHIMKPTRYQEESWKDYTARIRFGKMEARNKNRRAEESAVIEESSHTLQEDTGGMIPTAQTLNGITNIPARRIQLLTKENVIWQRKTGYNRQLITKLKKLNPNIKQIELAEELDLTTRQVRKIENSL